MRYDPFGAVLNGTPPAHGFTGENWDAATGLVNLRARWYDPAHGTFTSRDPFGGWASSPASQHPYQYAANSPMQYTDPSGKCIGVLGGADTLFCAMVVSAVIGGVINYGTQVYQNYQGGYRGWGTFTHVCADELAIAIASGAVGGFVGYALGPLTAVLTKSGLLGSIIAGAFEGGVSGGLTQIGGNLLSGKAWNTDLASTTLSSGIGGGIGGGLGWAARQVVRYVHTGDGIRYTDDQIGSFAGKQQKLEEVYQDIRGLRDDVAKMVVSSGLRHVPKWSRCVTGR